MRRLVTVTLLAWLVVIAVDFFLTGVVFARVYQGESSFLLGAERILQLLWLRYFGAIVWTGLVVWLISRLGVREGAEGFLLGLKIGAAAWGSFVLALLATATAPPSLIMTWFIVHALETAFAGAVAGAGLGARRLNKLTIRAMIFFAIMIGLTVGAQYLEWAPAWRSG